MLSYTLLKCNPLVGKVIHFDFLYMGFIDGLFYVMVLIMSVVIHEVAHGYSAYLLGDNTAYHKGRLTLNPIKHLDPFGSVILPLLLLLMNTNFLIGWAKPVPYNPNNLRDRKKGVFIVSIAGIIANIMIAVIFGLMIRFAPIIGFPSFELAPTLAFYKIASIIVIVNLILAIFNLVPIPPLDGSKILFTILPYKYRFIEEFLLRWGMFVFLFFIFFLWNKVAPIIYILFSLITGVPLF